VACRDGRLSGRGWYADGGQGQYNSQQEITASRH